jgi:predicted small secreted protein
VIITVRSAKIFYDATTCQVELLYTENLQIFKIPKMSMDTSGAAKDIQDTSDTVNRTADAPGILENAVPASITHDSEVTSDITEETENLHEFMIPKMSTDTSGAAKDIQDTSDTVNRHSRCTWHFRKCCTCINHTRCYGRYSGSIWH